ncbi:MAG: 2-C-methyl-D-erythritol 2,4-cyclodiphosphate synthase [Ruminococcaceae bacterium]|nr:2-C-methyl-D-erythritol 2,4-cyclodiphosphate synthase [Oscillospiraceae bacterium]
MRIGHGYDAHRFEDGKKMIIGGVTFDCPYGLMAHSDGDVLCHAICDALLGAAGLGDIGKLFPDNDMTYKNVYSMLLLEKVCERIREKGFEIEYIDSTLVAQQPKMAPYIQEMRSTVARYAGIPVERYNVKATTEEKMGFTGRCEGISAHAVCILKEN